MICLVFSIRLVFKFSSASIWFSIQLRGESSRENSKKKERGNFKQKPKKLRPDLHIR